MREGFIILLPGTESGLLQWGHWREGRIDETGQTSFEDVGKLAVKNFPVALVLPGQNTQTYTHEIPKMRRREREKAVLFSLEDRLSVPFDTLHVALHDEVKIEEASVNLVTVISKVYLQDVVNWARENKLNVQHILTDYDALTGTDLRPLALPNRVVYAGSLGYSLDSDWHDGPVNRADQSTILAAIGARLSNANNLMQGSFAPKSSLTETFARGWRVAALAACLGLAVLIFEGLQIRSISKQVDDVKLQTARLYTEYTGKAAPNNPALAAAQLVQKGQVAPTQFLVLSDIAFRALAEFDDVAIERLSFQDNRNELQLRLTYPSFERADAVQQAMQKAGGDFIPGGVREQNGRFVGEAVLKIAGES